MRVRDSLTPLGYVHRRDLVENGWRPDRLRAAVSAEGLVVRRRQWILAPNAPRALHLAAASGGRVACRIAGELHGAWALEEQDLPHLRLAPHQSDTCADAIVHRSLEVVPASPRSLVEPLVNALAQTAACLPTPDAAVVWESALNRGLLHPADLVRVQWPNIPARGLADATVAVSDSGLETRFVVGMRREGIDVRQQVWLLGRPVDGLIGDRLVVQIDGYAFHNDAQTRRADITRRPPPPRGLHSAPVRLPPGDARVDAGGRRGAPCHGARLASREVRTPEAVVRSIRPIELRATGRRAGIRRWIARVSTDSPHVAKRAAPARLIPAPRPTCAEPQGIGRGVVPTLQGPTPPRR